MLEYPMYRQYGAKELVKFCNTVEASIVHAEPHSPVLSDKHHGAGPCKGSVEGPAGPAIAVPLFLTVRNAGPLFK